MHLLLGLEALGLARLAVHQRREHLPFVSGFIFRVLGLEFWVQDLGLGVRGFGFEFTGFGFRVSGFVFRVSGSGARSAVHQRREHLPFRVASGCGKTWPISTRNFQEFVPESFRWTYHRSRPGTNFLEFLKCFSQNRPIPQPLYLRPETGRQSVTLSVGNQERSARYRAVEPQQRLQRHPEAGSSWPSWPQASHHMPLRKCLP